MGFFDDITIPNLWMKQPDGACEFNEAEGVWVWKISSEEEEPTELFIDTGEMLRFRVESELFVDGIHCLTCLQSALSLMLQMK